MDHDNVDRQGQSSEAQREKPALQDVQKQKLAKPCPRWRSENAFIGVMRLSA